MRYAALEEAFSVPELAGRQPSLGPAFRFSQRSLADWARRLPDLTEYQLPTMDAAGIDVQVLSLTVPGLQADVDAGIPVGAGTDATHPASCNPWNSLYWMVTGKTVGGTQTLSSGAAAPSLNAFADPGHILFGTDFPCDHGVSAAFTASLDAADNLTADDQAAISYRNAQALFPRPAQPPPGGSSRT